MGAEIDLFSTYSSGGLAVRSAPLVKLPESEIVAPLVARPRQEHDDPETVSADRPIKAVLVDVEDVLYDASAWQRWLGQIFAQLAPRTLEPEFARLWQEDFLPAVYRGQQDFHAAFAACLSALGLAAAHVEEIAAASRAQRRREEGARRPYPGARTTLSQLKSAGIACGALTNSNRTASALRQDLAKLGLAESFGHVFTSVDMKAPLPDAQCFAHALAVMNVSAAEALFVSHDARELYGAQEVGCQVVAFNARACVSGIPQIDRFDALWELAVPAAAAPVTT